MTDQKAIEIIKKNTIDNMNDFCSAVAHAANRLIECQWHPYFEKSLIAQKDVINHMSCVLLDIEYEDGRHHTCEGHGFWSEEKGFHFVPDMKNAYPESACIKHWMKIPIYGL